MPKIQAQFAHEKVVTPAVATPGTASTLIENPANSALQKGHIGFTSDRLTSGSLTFATGDAPLFRSYVQFT
jgi:hypothetical protein